MVEVFKNLEGLVTMRRRSQNSLIRGYGSRQEINYPKLSSQAIFIAKIDKYSLTIKNEGDL